MKGRRTKHVVIAKAEGTKNLAEVESRIEKWAAGATTPNAETIKGIIAQFAYWLEKEGYGNPIYLKIYNCLSKEEQTY